MSIFGDRVRNYRLAARLRQADFFLHGITQSQLSLIESGDLAPSPAKIDTLAEVLNVTAAELVSGTELQDRYETYVDVRPEEPIYSARWMRSKRLVAVEEAYLRVHRLCEKLAAVWSVGEVSVDDEAYYQFAARICRRALEAASEYDLLIVDRVFVLPSMIGESDVDFADLKPMLQRSIAYLRSLIVEFPEADTEVARNEIVSQIGLDRVDRFIDRLSA